MFNDYNHDNESKNSRNIYSNNNENRSLLLSGAMMTTTTTATTLEKRPTTTPTPTNNNNNYSSFSSQRRRRYSFPPPTMIGNGRLIGRQQQQESNTHTTTKNTTAISKKTSLLPAQQVSSLPTIVVPTTTMNTSTNPKKTRTLQYEEAESVFCEKTDASIFSSIRSMKYKDDEEETKMNDSEKYLKSSLLRKAFPERFLALIVTLIIEIPTLMMISGGSAKLCYVLGRSRYQLLVGFLPLASAISGNCGLQSSTLTTRGISHNHIHKQNFCSGWFVYEIGTGLWLGFGMGMIMGIFAFCISGYDAAFGITIGIAQVLSIFTAGITGTSAPLIFTYLFHQDCGKWSGPIETAVQDIVGSFSMVVLSYHLLRLLGANTTISPDDVCGEGTTF